MVLLCLFLFFIVYQFATYQCLFDVEIFTIENSYIGQFPFFQRADPIIDAQVSGRVHRRHSNGFGKGCTTVYQEIQTEKF